MTSVAKEAIGDPVGLVVRLVGEVERRLDATQIRAIVCAVVRERAGRRSLAQALWDDPSLLRTGRPPAPYCVAKLLMALREAGAHDISRPHCGQCGRERPWVCSQRGGQWACSPCSDKPAVCAGCGELRRVVSRDRGGHPRCAHCPDTAGDPLAELVGQVTGLDPALDADTVLAALGRATVRPAGQRRLAWAVLARPDLLTGAGYDAPAPAVLRFVDELIVAGASKVVRPPCPRCDEVKALSKLLTANESAATASPDTRPFPAFAAEQFANPPPELGHVGNARAAALPTAGKPDGFSGARMSCAVHRVIPVGVAVVSLWAGHAGRPVGLLAT